MTHVAGEEAPRAILGPESADERDVRPAEARACVAEGLAQEREPAGRAVPDGGLRDRNDDREKSIFSSRKPLTSSHPSSAERNFDGAGVVSGGFSTAIWAAAGDAHSVRAISVEIA